MATTTINSDGWRITATTGSGMPNTWLLESSATCAKLTWNPNNTVSIEIETEDEGREEDVCPTRHIDAWVNSLDSRLSFKEICARLDEEAE